MVFLPAASFAILRIRGKHKKRVRPVRAQHNDGVSAQHSLRFASAETAADGMAWVVVQRQIRSRETALHPMIDAIALGPERVRHSGFSGFAIRPRRRGRNMLALQAIL